MPSSEVISKTRSYEGDEISIKSLEQTLSTERERQNVDITKLKELRSRNNELSKALAGEIRRLRKFSDYIAAGSADTFLANLKEVLSYIPGFGKLFFTKRSIEELLKQRNYYYASACYRCNAMNSK